MAKTFLKQALAAYSPSDAWLSLVTTNLPEGLNQTFVNGAPLVFSSGYMIEATVAGDVVTSAIAGFSMNAAHNTTAGAYDVQFVPAVPGIHFHANFMGAAGIDNVLAASDLGLTRDVGYAATFLGAASPGYFVADSAGTVRVKIISFESDQVVANSTETKAVAGDTNARVRGVIIAAANGWYI